MSLWTRLQSFLSRFKAIAVDPEVNQRLADVDDEIDLYQHRILVDLGERKVTPFPELMKRDIERQKRINAAMNQAMDRAMEKFRAQVTPDRVRRPLADYDISIILRQIESQW